MHRGRTRVQSACQRCRKHKIKCSGLPPCRTCRARGLRCEFGADDKQILISEKYLTHQGRQEQLAPFRTNDTGADISDATHDPASTQRSDALPDSQPSIRDSPGDHFDIQDAEDVEHNGIANPLVPERPAFIQESSGQLRYLGHSSAYAFTQQVLQVLQQPSLSNPSPEFFPSFDGSAYKAELHAILPLVKPDISGLPSKGIALHYLQCVKFRTQPLFYLFDELDFNSHLNAFYKDAVAYSSANPVWYIHYLVLMAFGKALDPHERLEGPWRFQVPQYFQRALSLMPDMTYLADEPLETPEMLCCIALYLQCIDHRRAAISYIGLALRMAHLYALHLDLQESIVGSQNVERGRRIWWTVYALNQKLTSNTGLPNFLNDFDIKSPQPNPSPGDEDGTALLLHVKICQLLGLSIKRVYRSTENDRKSFVTATQRILKGAVDIGKDIKQYSESLFGEISRVAAHLELAYHQCIVLTCRPVLFCLLKMRFETSRNPPAAPPSMALMGLVQVCVDSAMRAVHILEQLRAYNLLDTFLPFDLECGYSATLALIMAGYVCPRILSPSDTIQNAKDVIATIAARGNSQATLRRLEIERMEELLHQRTQQAAECTSLNETYDPRMAAMRDMPAGQQSALDDAILFFDAFVPSNGVPDDGIMDLADALTIGDFDLLDQ
ncbi:hypothetical protein F5883DRAFT_478816 [Diaporthe sp. PMI_573]|nr:hypothetical protein F5883DRAFT_478816 [Diaporthaceae sp. PMI_573]